MNPLLKPFVWLGFGVKYGLLIGLSITALIGSLYLGWLFFLVAPIGSLLTYAVTIDFIDYHRYGLNPIEIEYYKQLGYKLAVIILLIVLLILFGPELWSYFVIFMKYFTIVITATNNFIIELNQQITN